jgi:hypothetical protein
MRNNIYILLLLTQFSCKAPKPEGLILRVQFQPEKTYSISTIRGTETVITYSGEDIAMQKIKSNNIKNPTISKIKTKTDAELVTEKSSSVTSFPVILTYKRIMSLDGKNQIPEGTVVHGEIIGEKLPTFSKVVSGTLDFDQKERLLQTVRSNFEQLDFPEQRLKIGDQFSVDRTSTMPMEGSEIEMVTTTTYKLLSIKDNLAQFELSQNYLMTPKMMDNSFTGSGSGKGQLSYDIANFLVSDYSIKTELFMNKKLNYFEFDLKTINEFSQTTRMNK